MASSRLCNFFAFKSMTISVMLFLLSLLLNRHHCCVHAIPEPELEEALSALRSKGYNLFGNAITTSDLRFYFLAGAEFTFFAPTDDSLYAIDMKASAADYLDTLSLHIVPRRLSISDLRSLITSKSPPLRTLLPHRNVHIAGKRSMDSFVITANGVEIVFPGLFSGRHVVVHGLTGILSPKSGRAPPRESLTPPRISGQRTGRNPPFEGLTPPRMSSTGDADYYSNDGGLARPNYDKTYEDGISPVSSKDFSSLMPDAQPPVMMSPVYGFPVPDTYGLRSPVEAPETQESSEEAWVPEIPSPAGFSMFESDSDGFEGGKKLEVMVGEVMASRHSWFSGGKGRSGTGEILSN